MFAAANTPRLSAALLALVLTVAAPAADWPPKRSDREARELQYLRSLDQANCKLALAVVGGESKRFVFRHPSLPGIAMAVAYMYLMFGRLDHNMYADANQKLETTKREAVMNYQGEEELGQLAVNLAKWERTLLYAEHGKRAAYWFDFVSEKPELPKVVARRVEMTKAFTQEAKSTQDLKQDVTRVRAAAIENELRLARPNEKIDQVLDRVGYYRTGHYRGGVINLERALPTPKPTAAPTREMSPYIANAHFLEK